MARHSCTEAGCDEEAIPERCPRYHIEDYISPSARTERSPETEQEEILTALQEV